MQQTMDWLILVSVDSQIRLIRRRSVAEQKIKAVADSTQRLSNDATNFRATGWPLMSLPPRVQKTPISKQSH